MPPIYYLVADHPLPSWGTGMLYEHVRLLRASGYDARVLHERSPFRPGWVELSAPVDYLDRPGFTPSASDVVVVPEILAAHPVVREHAWRRVVFVQASFLVVRGIGDFPDYAAIGFEAAMAVLPHVAEVVERHFAVPASVVPPLIAPYFFDAPPAPREHRILLPFKEGYRHLGIPDQDIARHLLAREAGRRPGWSFVPLEGFSHRAVAELMQTSELLVNVYSHEAFNTTVPEAMAAGCVPVCYQAFGGRDFLRAGENALVFENQQVFALVDRVCELMDHFEEHRPLLDRIRRAGRETASRFTAERTATALEAFFRQTLRLSPA